MKSAIETSQGDGFAVAQQKLIHSGKVLKDDVTLEQAEVKENGFLVCMITKVCLLLKLQVESNSLFSQPKAAPRAPSTAATAAAAAPPAPASVSSTDRSAASTSTPSTETNTSVASITPAAQATTTETTNVVQEESSAAVRQLCDMGFPEDQVHAALRAAFNNADRAVEYLMNGIPENIPAAAAPASAEQVPSTDGVPAGGIESFRQYPQFDQMRRMVQSNPAALPAVLQQIGTQSPEYLRLIHDNQEEFVRMMNEPVTEAAAAAVPNPPPSSAALPSSGSNPSAAEMMQVFQSMPPEQRQQMATAMGMSPEQMQQLTQMMATMPPEAISQLLASMGAAAGGVGPGGVGGPSPGVHQVQLTDEEMAAVNRLCDMGFDRNDVIQAYLACEKNEALAANFLMDMGN